MKKFLLAVFLFFIGCEPDEEYIEVNTTDTLYVTLGDSMSHTPIIITAGSWAYDDSMNYGVVLFAKIKNTYDYTLYYPTMHGALYQYDSEMETVVAEDSSGMAYAIGDTNYVKYLYPDSIVYGHVWLYVGYDQYKYGVWMSWQ